MNPAVPPPPDKVPTSAAASAAPKPQAQAAAPQPAVPPPPLPLPAHVARFASLVPSIPFQPADYAAKGYHLDAAVAPDTVVAVAVELDKQGLALDTITGVDWPAAGQMEVVYDFFHPTQLLRVVVRTRIPRDNPDLPTIHKVFPGANWHEREAHDFFGIRFLGHPNLTPFLLPEDATYHPLRKDFSL